jgi:hypothetical protein
MPALSQPLKLLGNYGLIQTFPIHMPDGQELVGTLWATRTRRSGRRIQVRNADGVGLFDTNDCYDQGNAANSLQHWIRAQAEQAESHSGDAELLLTQSSDGTRSLRRA